MTWIGRVSGGHRFEDIESGYRVFRVGPLLEAQEYYEGYKYSETVEVAVLPHAARLPRRQHLRHQHPRRAHAYPALRRRRRCRLHAARLVPARLLAEMPRRRERSRCAARPSRRRDRSGGDRLLLTLLKPVLPRRRQRALVRPRLVPLRSDLHPPRMALARRRSSKTASAVMFPYGIIPWLPDALLYPLLGDWVVTLSMVAGAVFMLVGDVPVPARMREPGAVRVFLLNPLLWNGVTQFQLTTIWSFAFFFLAAWQFERRHTVRASLLLRARRRHPSDDGRPPRWRLRAPGRRSGCGGCPGALRCALARPSRSPRPPSSCSLSTPALTDAARARIALSTFDNMRRLSIVAARRSPLPPLTAWIYRHQRRRPRGPWPAHARRPRLRPTSGRWERSSRASPSTSPPTPSTRTASYRVVIEERPRRRHGAVHEGRRHARQ